MNLFSRIAIGTANFGSEYNGAKVSEKDIEKILGYCQCSGIDTLDCAVAYGWDWQQANSYFDKIIKVGNVKDIWWATEAEPYCVMAHSSSFYNDRLYSLTASIRAKRQQKVGVSLYSPDEANNFVDLADVIQVPYSLYDRRFETLLEYWKKYDTEQEREIHVRSIFLRGRILKDGIEPCECIKFCLCNPHIDKVIIGVDSFEQLQRNLDFLHRWANLEKHDEKLLDTRQWKE